MDRTYFMTTDRIGFSVWQESDGEPAASLWGNPEVTRYICASGTFTEEEIRNRLALEIRNGKAFGIQYWPIFERETGALIGCCGLRPKTEGCYEIGFHLKPEFWRKGLATEAANCVIRYAFEELKAEKLFAGHNPHNTRSRKVLLGLGMNFIGDEYYPPTGLEHPSYEMVPGAEKGNTL